MLKTALKILASAIPLGIIVLMLWVNVNLFSVAALSADERVKQLNFIGRAIEEGADTDMQDLYPEGYMFLNCLYGLAWCDALSDLPLRPAVSKHGLSQVHNALVRVQSNQARAIFSSELNLPYGAYYTGWSTYLLGRKLQLDRNDTTGVYRFRFVCSQIAKAVDAEIFPESYPSMAWPADAVLCIASLTLHDKLFPGKYHKTIRNWIAKVRQHLDPDGLIPHAAMSNGKLMEGARGSSQCLMLSFLNDIDSAFAAEQFALFSQRFIDSRFGVKGIREYPLGVFGLGDVDSGPVIFGMGGAASIVGIRALGTYKHNATHELQHGIEAFALPLENQNEKKYLFGMLPMADAFITWSQGSADVSDGDSEQRRALPWKFIVLSGLLILSCAALLYWFWR